MSQTALSDSTECFRHDANRKLDPANQSALGQYMTSASIAHFMASLFEKTNLEQINVLDAGAGVGSLTSAFLDEFSNRPKKPSSISAVAYEMEPILFEYLRTSMDSGFNVCSQSGISFSSEVRTDDFISDSVQRLQNDLFSEPTDPDTAFTHAILNPPYKKISSKSAHRQLLSSLGIETGNLYTAFLALTIKLLEPGGELVAIVPRSFCNGPYFRPFRELFLSEMTLRHIHVFDSRSNAFRENDVLQENIIFHAVKGGKQTSVTITSSPSGLFSYDSRSKKWIASDMTKRRVHFSTIVKPGDPEKFIHIATSNLEQNIVDRISHFKTSLADLGLEVSTGPVVDFRLKEDLRKDPGNNTAPLLYPIHFRGSRFEWPKVSKKPNAIEISSSSERWLWPNDGHYVVTKRFTSKEEKKRIVASVYDSSLPGTLVGFENHLNVFHHSQRGLDSDIANGLSIFLNSSLIDRFFRQFNGHTQVNATDLRNLYYPSTATLKRLSKEAGGTVPSQLEIDRLIEKEIAAMSNEESDNPLTAQQKIDDALAIVKALGMPRAQHNERSALTLLAILDLQPEEDWSDSKRPLMGITPIMDFCREAYGKQYAPNTRETFRRQTMHQFVDAAIAVYNPDKLDRPVNSPKACYQISSEAYEVVISYGTENWDTALNGFLEHRETLSQKYAMERKMTLIPVEVAKGEEITLTPGIHSKLIKDIIEEFAPRFAPGSEVIYVGDTGEKTGYFQRKRLSELGVQVDKHGKMPDVVLYYPEKNWLLLVESVTSHGPVDGKRHGELSSLFEHSKPGLVYVTAFPDRAFMGKYLSVISWETEVWCADAPTHLIHFNGERFLGPYEVEET